MYSVQVKDSDAKTAAEVLDKARKRISRMSAGIVLAIILYGLVFLLEEVNRNLAIQLGEEPRPGFAQSPLFVLVVIAFIYLAIRIYLQRLWHKTVTRNMLYDECDPQKYKDVIDIWASKSKRAYKKYYLEADCFLYVIALIWLKQYDLALDRLTQIAKVKKNLASQMVIAYQRGIIFANLGRMDESRECLRYYEDCVNNKKIYLLSTRNTLKYRNHLNAVIAFKDGDYEKSAEYYRKLCSDNLFGRADKIIFRYNLALAEEALGDTKSANYSLAQAYDLGAGTPHPLMAEITEKYKQLAE